MHFHTLPTCGRWKIILLKKELIANRTYLSTAYCLSFSWGTINLDYCWLEFLISWIRLFEKTYHFCSNENEIKFLGALLVYLNSDIIFSVILDFRIRLSLIYSTELLKSIAARSALLNHKINCCARFLLMFCELFHFNQGMYIEQDTW